MLRAILPSILIVTMMVCVMWSVASLAGNPFGTLTLAERISQPTTSGLNPVDLTAWQFECMQPELPFVKISVCLHGAKDSFTKCMKSTGKWEAEATRHAINVLRANPDMGVVDMGSNVGLFAIMAAALGHQTVAIDPSPSNTDRIVKGAQLTGVTDRMVVLQNAVGKPNATIPFFVNKNSVRSSTTETESSRSRILVPSISPDEILAVTPSRRLFLKIDIESNEELAFRHASLLFASRDIPLVLLEWGQRRSSHLPSFFFDRGYHVFSDKGENITDTPFGEWTWDVWFVQAASCPECIPPYVDWYRRDKFPNMPPRC